MKILHVVNTLFPPSLQKQNSAFQNDVDVLLLHNLYHFSMCSAIVPWWCLVVGKSVPIDPKEFPKKKLKVIMGNTHVHRKNTHTRGPRQPQEKVCLGDLEPDTWMKPSFRPRRFSFAGALFKYPCFRLPAQKKIEPLNGDPRVLQIKFHVWWGNQKPGENWHKKLIRIDASSAGKLKIISNI